MHIHKRRVRVHYPLTHGQMVLRSDADWDLDIKPAAVTGGGTCFEFDLAFDRAFAYCKPVVVAHGIPMWASGDNVLALASRREPLEVYPHFAADSVCSACTLRTVTDPNSGRRHQFRVFYPPGYHENTLARYPVLYMQDGQNLFFPDEAFGGQHWRVAETLRVLDTMNVMRRTIVVGVYPGNRMVDYTQPGYEAYGRFLVEHLKPAVDAEYRTLDGPAHTAVMGSSLGGVVSFYLAWQYPSVFGMAGCLSSTFRYQDDLHERVESEPRRNVRLYIDSGWPRDNYEVTRDMRELLVLRGFREGTDLVYFAFPEAIHDETHWAMRAHLPFQFFFGRDDGRARPERG